MSTGVVSSFAARMKKVLRPLKKPVYFVLFHGRARWCPICEKGWRKFLRFGDPERQEARCPGCGSLERHRFAWLYFSRMTDLFDGRPKKMLHVAPEPWQASRLRRLLGEGYLSADLLDPAAMVKMDVTDIQFPAESFDVIYCSHVLEHVPDDRKAMGEFFRVLKSDGWAMLLVPITVDQTVEAPAVTDLAERLKLFGQEDHVRRYGPDYVERLREAGFMVKISRPGDLCDDKEIARLGLTEASGEIYCCFKP